MFGKRTRCGAAVLLMLLAGPGLPATAWSADVVLRGAGNNDPDHVLSRARVRYIDTLRERSNGDLRIRWLGGREIVPDDEVAEAVARGVFELGSVTNTAYEKLVPESLTLDGSRLSSADLRANGYFELLQSHYHERDLHLLAAFRGLRFYLLFGKRVPVPQSLDDLSGLKMRLPGHYTRVTEPLGIRAVRLAPSDMYSALDSGVIDGVVSSVPGMVANGVHEITGSLIDVPLFYGTMTLFMNLQRWNSLTPQQQALMTAVAEDVEDWAQRDLQALHEQAMATIGRSGVRIVSLPDEDEAELLRLAYQGFWDEIVARMPDSGADLRALALE